MNIDGEELAGINQYRRLVKPVRQLLREEIIAQIAVKTQEEVSRCLDYEKTTLQNKLYNLQKQTATYHEHNVLQERKQANVETDTLCNVPDVQSQFSGLSLVEEFESGFDNYSAIKASCHNWSSTRTTFGQPFSSIASSGHMVAMGSMETVVCVDTKRSTQIPCPTTLKPTTKVEFLNNWLLAAGSLTGQLSLFDYSRNILRNTTICQASRTTGLKSMSETMLLSSSHNGTWTLLDVARCTIIKQKNINTKITAVGSVYNSNYFMTASDDVGSVFAWDTRMDNPAQKFQMERVSCAEHFFSGCSTILATNGSNMRLFDLRFPSLSFKDWNDSGFTNVKTGRLANLAVCSGVSLAIISATGPGVATPHLKNLPVLNSSGLAFAEADPGETVKKVYAVQVLQNSSELVVLTPTPIHP